MKPALVGALQRVDRVVCVAEVEVRGVYEDFVSAFGRDCESPQGGFGKGFGDGAPLVGIVGDGAETVVRLDKKHAGAAALETNDARLAHLAAVEADVIRTDAGRQRFEVKEFGLPLVDF